MPGSLEKGEGKGPRLERKTGSPSGFAADSVCETQLTSSPAAL